MPRVSVVIPTYNWSSALRLAIHSALRQTFQDFELLVVGDGCTDDSERVAGEFPDPRVRWHNLEENAGCQTGPNNWALAHATGEYVAYHGHDDLWHASHLATLVRCADENAADVAYSVASMIGPGEHADFAVSGLPAPEDSEPACPGIPPTSLLHRRDLIARIGPWRLPDEIRLPPDMDLIQRAWDAGAKFAGTFELTAFKFTTSWRKDAYRKKDTSQQEAWLIRMEDEPDFLYREAMRLLVADARGRRVSIGSPQTSTGPGMLSRMFRRARGLDRENVERLPGGGIRIPADAACFEDGWHPAELDGHGVFRWSGPGIRSSLTIENLGFAPSEILVRIKTTIHPSLIGPIGLSVDGTPASVATRTANGGTLLTARVRKTDGAAPALRLEFSTRSTLAPSELSGSSSDKRRLGFALEEIQLLP